jgi:hypothetical protein
LEFNGGAEVVDWILLLAERIPRHGVHGRDIAAHVAHLVDQVAALVFQQVGLRPALAHLGDHHGKPSRFGLR